jgi:hypothetical protein
MSTVNNIVLETRTEELERILSPFIEEQFPDFMKADYRKLVLFIKSYYEWCEKTGNPGYVLSNVNFAQDTDKSLEEFYSHFRETYLRGFVDTFATDSTGRMPNKNTLLKKIREFYGEKGTESAYRFLFRVLYDSDLEIAYPGDDILKLSDGNWIEEKSIKTSSSNGSALFSCKNGQLIQYSGNAVVASAFVDNVIQYTVKSLTVTEFFVTNINGTFDPDLPIVAVKDGTEYTEIPFSVLGSVFIELPGENYRIGDTVGVVDVQSGYGFSARVEQTGLRGSIKKLAITNSGVNYANDAVVTIFSDTGQQSARVIALRTVVTNYAGYFSGNRGKVSANKFIQDGNYYQPFSYALKPELGISQYFDVLRQIIHPAGMKMFGSVLLKGEIENTVSSSSQAVYYEKPVVGRYTPYTLRTHNNLRSGIFLPDQIRGATLQVWLSGYSIAGNTSSGITAGWAAAAFNESDPVIAVDSREFPPDPLTGKLDRILGVRNWTSLVRGHTFSHPSIYPNASVWLTPNFKPQSINSHASVLLRPIQYYFSGSSQYSALRSLGFSGPSAGALGLTASRSYFAVAKPKRIGTAGNWYANSQRWLIGDGSGGYQGIWYGITGGTSCVGTFNFLNASTVSGVTGAIGSTGSWGLVSSVYSVGAGSSGPLSLFFNGVCCGTVNSSRLDSSSLNTHNILVGMRVSDSADGAFDGEIAEVLMYQGAVSDSDRQKIEGYLAHKYGLSALLPSAHTYKSVAPGASFSGGRWYGNTGDFYPNGYNPYIGSTAQVGPDGTTAPLGSVFRSSRMGYTYTVAYEYGNTAHNPIGAPLGGVTAWLAHRESALEPSNIRGLVLWLKPENIGVCGSVVNGASADVWRDASPSANHALPPTWDKWNGIFTSTLRSGEAQGTWTRQVYTTNPITRLQWVFNGLCGGFTTDRLMAVGLNSDPTTNASINSIDYSFYSYGPYLSGTQLTASRRILYSENGAYADISNVGTNYTAFDNTIFEIEYVEPNIIYRMDGVVRRTVFAGYNLTFYMDSSFHNTTPWAARNGHCFTVLGMWNGINPVVPTASTVNSTSGITSIVYAGLTVDKLRPVLAFRSAAGATGVCFNGGVLYSPDTAVGATTMYHAIGLGGNTYGAGSSAEKILTGQHMYLTRPLDINGEADVFMVFRPTQEGYSYGIGLFSSSQTTRGISSGFDAVLYHRSYNSQDSRTTQPTSVFYTITPAGRVLYPGEQAVGLVGFRPGAGNPNAQNNFIAYDPHVSGVCMGTAVGEWTRDGSNRIQSFLNGGESENTSPVTGIVISSVNAPENEDYVLRNGLQLEFDFSDPTTSGDFFAQRNSNAVRDFRLVETPKNVLAPLNPAHVVDSTVTRVEKSAIIGLAQPGANVPSPSGIAPSSVQNNDEIYTVTPQNATANGRFYINKTATPTAWSEDVRAETWTFCGYIRRTDGSALPSTIFGYNHVGRYVNQAVTISPTDYGSGWRFFSLTVNSSPESNAGATSSWLVGLENLGNGITYHICGLQLLPYKGASPVSGVNGITYGSFSRIPILKMYGGPLGYNTVQIKKDPWGSQNLVWRAVNTSVNVDKANWNENGGFATNTVTLDTTKTYRFSVWINRVNLNDFSDGRGTVYFGPSVNTKLIQKTNGTVQNNPYFTYMQSANPSTANQQPQNTWMLVVGHIHAKGTAADGVNHPNSGFYTVNGGGLTFSALVGGSESATDYIFPSDADNSGKNQLLRVFLYGCFSPGVECHFMRPRIDLIDGTEPTIEELLSNSTHTVRDTSPNGHTGEILLHEPIPDTEAGGSVNFALAGFPAGIVSNRSSNSNNTGERDKTYESWIKVGGVSPVSGHYMFFGGGGLPYVSVAGTSFFYSYYGAGGVQKGILSASGTAIANTWNHVVVTVRYLESTNSTEHSLYVNGRLAATDVQSGPETATGGSTWVTGNRSRDGAAAYITSGFNYSYFGKISVTRMYSRALNAAEVYQNYNALRGRYGL